MLTVTIGGEMDAAAALIVPVRSGAMPTEWQSHATADRFTAEPETTCACFGPHGRVVLVGLGDDPQAAGAAATSLLLRNRHVTIDARGLSAVTAAQLAAGACLRAWRYDRLHTRPDEDGPLEDGPLIESLALISGDPQTEKCWSAIAAGVEGTLFARDLVTEPSDTLTPQGFVARLGRLREAGITVNILDVPALKEQGFGGLLAVGHGSAHPPCLAILRWAGTSGAAPVALVGKGITFDTGGICIKPADHMWEMRADMAGAAACAGAMLALARRHSPAPAIAILPLAENAIGADSYRPGDVLRMLSGMTVQVVDTDAEGRLVLADALAFALREQPRAVIDLATLTGSIVVALGHHKAGLFSNDDKLAEAVSRAGAVSGEPIWRMPIDEAHRRALDSDIADIKHCVDERGQPDACQAAAFLQEFVTDGVPWAHIDIAGVENREEAEPGWPKGATGFGVRLLDRLVADTFETNG